jgi:glyoxylase-like metal-dependent hydrolase (beta-lactamase superfamily II)
MNPRFIPDGLLEPLTAHIWHFRGQQYWGEEVHCYLVEDGDNLLLIDVPNYRQPAAGWLASLTPRPRIYLTHAASSGDAASWQKYGNIQVVMHSLDLRSRWLRCQPDVLLSDDQWLSPHVQAIHAPGHSAGHTMYYDARDGGSLFSGDGILLHRGRWEIEVAPGVAGKLAGLPFVRLLPNHYDLVLDRADEEVRSALKGDIR